MSTSSFYKSSGSTPAVENSIQTAVTQAAGSATQAQTSATSANTSATNAQSSLNSFQQYYLGAYSSAPSTTQIGSMYFNTSVAQLYIWSGNSWDVTASANNLQDTDGLIEGSSNLYFTNERVDDRVNALLTAGSNITLAYNDAANTLTIASTGGLADLSSSTTNDLTEGSSNLYFTNARASSAITGGDLDMGGNKVLFANVYSAEGNLPSANTYHGMFAHVHGTGKGYFAHAGNWHKLLDETSSTTTDLSEGSNLYYTDERVDDRVSNLLTAGSNITLTYNDAANTLTIASTASGGGGSSTFTGLTDTPASLGTAGQYLAVNSGASALEFVAAPSGGSSGATTLSGLNDVSNATPANNQVLTWDSGTSLWQPITPTSSSSGIALTDLSASNNPPGNATLNYNSSTGDFIFTPPDLSTYITATSTTTFTNKSGNISQWTNDSGYLTSVPSQTLYDLSNVYSSSSPSDGQVLSWDNANSYWKPTTVSAGSSGIALTDLSASNGVAGNASLSYNNSTGAFTFIPPDLSGYATTSSLSSYATTASLATVATSGAYGDLSGTPNLSSYLTDITGQSLYSLSNVNTSASPADGQVLTWDNTNSYWSPTTVSAGTSFAAADYVKVDPYSAQPATVSGSDSISIGRNTSVSSTFSVAIGSTGFTSSGANYSTAIGWNANSQSAGGVALGAMTAVGTNESYSTALGYNTGATAANQLMLGANNATYGFTSILVGNSSYTPSNAMDLTTKDYVDTAVAGAGGGGSSGGLGSYGVVNSTGTAASATGTDAIAIGESASAPIQDAVCIGNGASATANLGYSAVAIGLNTSVTSYQGVAIGESAVSNGYGVALGSYTDATATYSIAIGNSAQATATDAIVIGRAASANNSGNIVIGRNANSTSNRNLIINNYGTSTGAYNTLVGANHNNSTHRINASGSYNTCLGYYTQPAGSQGKNTHVGYAAGNTNYKTNVSCFGYLAQSQTSNSVTLGDTTVNSLRCATTSITSISDERDKTEIATLDVGLDYVNAVEPKVFYKNSRGSYYDEVYTNEQLVEDETLTQSYTFNQDAYDSATNKTDMREFGWIAQQVETALPAQYQDTRLTVDEVDPVHGYDVKRFNGSDMVPILWKALRELSNKHDQLQSEHDALLARVVALENA